MFYRGYDPAIGRMLQVDPYAPMYASTTTYNYAMNNPVMMNDPSGGYTYANAAADRLYKINNPDAYTQQWAADFRAYSDSQITGEYADQWKAIIGFLSLAFSEGGSSFSFTTTHEGKEYSVSLLFNGEGGMQAHVGNADLGLVYSLEQGGSWSSVGTMSGAQTGVNITVTNEITGYTSVKGYPIEVSDGKGGKVIYTVPLYKVIVSGRANGKKSSKEFNAIRYGVYYNGKGSPTVVGVDGGTYNGTWRVMDSLGESIHIDGAGNNNAVWIHVGPTQGYVPGANRCVLIFGSGQWGSFKNAVYEYGGGTYHYPEGSISITFQQATAPPLSPKK